MTSQPSYRISRRKYFHRCLGWKAVDLSHLTEVLLRNIQSTSRSLYSLTVVVRFPSKLPRLHNVHEEHSKTTYSITHPLLFFFQFSPIGRQWSISLSSCYINVSTQVWCHLTTRYYNQCRQKFVIPCPISENASPSTSPALFAMFTVSSAA